MIEIVKRRWQASRLESVDGAYVGYAGGTYEVFHPRWWQLHRWLAWWASKRAKGTVVFQTRMLDGSIAERTMRVWQVVPRPRARIEDQFKRPPIT